MSWNWTTARAAAAEVRAAQFGREVIDTIRPRTGLLRSRAPLPLLLYVASLDGLLVDQDGSGFAVLQPPLVDERPRSGGCRVRFLRWLDRQWEFVVFGSPPAACMLVAVGLVVLGGWRTAGVLAVLLGLLWVAVVMTFSVVGRLRWFRRPGASAGRPRSRAAQTLPGHHWFAPLVHQPDPDQVDALARLMTERLSRLLRAYAERSVAGKGRVGLQATETLVLLTSGVSTGDARTLLARSLRTVQDDTRAEDVIVLAPPSRLEEASDRDAFVGGFLPLYLVGMVLVIVVCAGIAADTEAAACAATSCAGRPATYGSAIRWLLQRLLFTDPPTISPATTRAAVLGWLISLTTPVTLLVVAETMRQQIVINRQSVADQRKWEDTLVGLTRALVIVATDTERAAVLAAVRERTGRQPVQDRTGRRTVYTLGVLGDVEVMLAQTGEAGTATAAGALSTAQHVIPHVRPDCVVLAGICLGLRPDGGQRIGDIVVAQRVQGIDQRKETDGRTIWRGVSVGPSPVLLDRFRAARDGWEDPARVHIGVVLSGNLLVNSRATVAHLRREFPDAIAGEMEGTGVYEATTEELKPDWIMVKAICDWGFDKTDDAQPLAARNAAEYVVRVLAAGGIPRRA